MKPYENSKQELKKNSAQQPTLEELNRKAEELLAECGECPAKPECEAFSFASAALLYLNSRRNKRNQETWEDEPGEVAEEWEDADAEAGDAAIPHPMDELNDAVYDLVDDLFRVVDKIAGARKYLDRLDGLAEMSLDYLSAIGVPQLSPED